jgi:hypothetical protein
MIRFCLAFVAIGGCLTWGLPVRAQMVSGFDLVSDAERHAEARIHAALAQRVDFDLADMPLKRLVDFLKQHGVPARLDVRALDDYGISDDVPIRFQQSGITLRAALNLILNELYLTWTIYNEVLLITTISSNCESPTARVYDVTHLLPRRSEPVVHGYHVSRFDPLIEVILGTIATESWLEYGGPAAIEAFELNHAAVLVVSQTRQAHEQIERLLAGLRHIDQQHGAAVSSRPPAIRRTSGLPRTGLR